MLARQQEVGFTSTSFTAKGLTSLKGATYNSCLLATGILLLLSFALPANAHTDYADVYPPNSASTSVVGINDTGDIVGNYDIGGSQFGFIDDRCERFEALGERIAHSLTHLSVFELEWP